MTRAPSPGGPGGSGTGSDVVAGEVVSSTTGPATPREVLQGRVMEPVDEVVRAVLTVPGVRSLHAGLAGAAATLLPGRRVAGVALRPTGTEVHVVVRFGVDVRAVAQQVHDAVTALGPLAPQPVTVHVDDVA